MNYSIKTEYYEKRETFRAIISPISINCYCLFNYNPFNMKKYILLTILSIFLIGNVYAQDSTKVELTKETIYKDVKNALIQLGEALKVGAEHVYVVLVKQQVANSIVNLSVSLLLLIGAMIGFNVAKNTYKAHVLLYQMKNGENGKPDLSCIPDIDDTAKGIASVFISIATGCLVIAFLIFTITNASTTITGFVNPEYGAIKEIMNMIK